MSTLQMIWILIYVVMNVIGYAQMVHDKKLAKTNQRRTPEKTLFTWAAVGGGLGSIIAMQTKRHKTQHMSFRIGMPLLFILNLVVYGLVYIILP